MAELWVRRGAGALGALLLAAACGLPACNLQAPPGPRKSVAPTARASGAAAPTAAPSLGLGVAAKADVLRPPAGGNATLAGTVAIDAGYMVAAGAGNILSHNGAQIVAAGAGNLIGPDGASLVGPDGASLVAAGGGNVVAQGGLRLIGPDGATLIGMDGASLVGPDGASLVGPDGASMVAAGAGNYRLGAENSGLGAGNSGLGAGNYALRQAGAAPSGAMLPAAAMRVGLVDLRDGKPVPVGVDGAGNPVYTVYSDLGGRFSLFVPEALKGYVRVIAESPARDARLLYDAIGRAGTGTAEVDEDTIHVAAILRNAFATRFDDLLSLSKAELEAQMEKPRELNPNLPEYYQTLVRPMLHQFAVLQERRSFWKMDPVKRRAIGRAAADKLLAACDFSNVGTANQKPFYKPENPDELALDALRDAMSHIRRNAEPLLKAEGSAAFSQRVAAIAQARLPGSRATTIVKPADMARFLVTAFLTDRRPGESASIGSESDHQRMLDVEAVLKELRILSKPDESGRLRAAGQAVVYHMLYVFKYQDNPDPAAIEYGPVGQGIIDYLWTVETGVPGDLGRPSPTPAAPAASGGP